MTTTAPVSTPNVVDLHGLERLRHRAAKDDAATVNEAAVQFEALFIGMMLESARSARLGGGILDGAQTQQYLELMDQQVALELARGGGFGFARMLAEQLAPRADAQPAAPTTASGALAPRLDLPVPRSSAGAAAPAAQTPAPGAFPGRLPPSMSDLAAQSTRGDSAARIAEPDAEGFVARFLPEASEAAEALGIEPRLLLAQAALETGWGKALEAESAPAHNLFGIKAGQSWTGERASHWTMEQGAAGLERKREDFRAYDSTAASFRDYVDLVSSAPRYSAARASAASPEGYVRAIAEGGYATDPAYAEKWLAIYHGERLTSALRSVTMK